jgi:small subunit ribosomal protein S21e
MQNEDERIVDLYIPRKCDLTGRILTADDHASVHINIAEVDETGTITGKNDSIVIGGFFQPPPTQKYYY